MGRRLLLATAALTTSLMLAGCAPSAARPAARAARPDAAPLTVAAASSLRDAFDEIARAYEAAGGGEVTVEYAASGVLQKQIEGGAPIDVFASASATQIDALVSAGLASAEETAAFAGNDLVVFVPRGNPKGIRGPGDLAKAERLTTGDPEIAPHGAKAREWLTGLGSWEGLRGRFVFAESSAQTLAYVARGEVDAGIGFATEVRGGDAVETVYTVPADAVTPVRYFITTTVGAGHPEAARRFVAFVLSAEGQAILARSGFEPAAGK